MNKALEIHCFHYLWGDVLESAPHILRLCPKSSLGLLYIGIIEQHFRYCCSVWGFSGSGTLLQLQKLLLEY